MLSSVRDSPSSLGQTPEEGRATEERDFRFASFRAGLDASPIAINTGDANEQHYQVPTEFYLHVLGPRLKYSSGYWPSEHTALRNPRRRCLSSHAKGPNYERTEDSGTRLRMGISLPLDGGALSEFL